MFFMVGVNGDFANTVFFLKVKKAVYPLSGLTGFPAKSVFNDPDCYVKDIWYGTVHIKRKSPKATKFVYSYLII